MQGPACVKILEYSDVGTLHIKGKTTEYTGGQSKQHGSTELTFLTLTSQRTWWGIFSCNLVATTAILFNCVLCISAKPTILLLLLPFPVCPPSPVKHTGINVGAQTNIPLWLWVPPPFVPRIDSILDWLKKLALSWLCICICTVSQFMIREIYCNHFPPCLLNIDLGIFWSQIPTWFTHQRAG